MNEHEFRETVVDDVFYPNHAPRVSTSTFERTKREGKAHGDVCAISGHADGIEYHHLICEDAFADAVDWKFVRAVAIGEITELPIYDPDTELPTGGTYDVRNSLLWLLLELTKLRGFDWRAFDPAMPVTFVDSPANMLVLHERFHRSSERGIHRHTFPIWVFQALPRVPGFVYSPAELAARHLPAITSSQ